MEKRIIKSVLVICALSLLIAGQAQAGTITVQKHISDFANNCGQYYKKTVVFEDLCEQVDGGGWLEVWACGDFYDNNEYVRVFANLNKQNQKNFGIWLNGNSKDDLFPQPAEDYGDDYQMIESGKVFLTQAEVADMISGGELAITFYFSRCVEDLNDYYCGLPQEQIGVRFSYEADCNGTPVIPTPAAAGMGLVGLGLMAARRGRKA